MIKEINKITRPKQKILTRIRYFMYSLEARKRKLKLRDNLQKIKNTIIKIINKIELKTNNMIKIINNRIRGINNLKKFSFTLFVFIFSFIFNTNYVLAVDTTAPTVNMTYGANPSGVGTNTITARYSESIASNPTISINQPGSTDISNASMTTPATTWTGRSASEANTWRSVTYGNGIFVAVAISGTNRVMTSPDGITWTARAAAEANNWNYVTFGNGLFVAVAGTGTNRVMTSPDGITWTARVAAAQNSWGNVTYGNGLFVATSYDGTVSNAVMTSPDGITWTPRSVPEANAWYGVTYGNGTFVSVSGNGTNRVLTSTDGINWSVNNPPELNSWRSVTFGNGQFVMVGVTGTSRVMTSPDGITWTARTAASGRSWINVTYGDGVYVAVAYDGVIGDCIMTSRDGITWTSKTSPAGNQWTNITYGNGQFVSISSDGTNRVMTATSGYTYDYTVNQANGSTYVDGLATVSLSSVNDLAGNASTAPVNNLFNIDTTASNATLTYTSNPVKVGTQTVTATFSDAITSAPTISINQQGSTDITNVSMTTIAPATNWTIGAGVAGTSYNSVAYGNGLFVAAGTVGKIETSPDGITWTLRTTPEANTLTSITFGNGLFVAVSSDGTNRVITSPDGITWTARTAAEANTWYGVTYGNGVFVAVADTGTNRVMTSTDGITWTARSASEASTWHDVTYGNGIFVAVAQSGTNIVMTSPDGITWTSRTSPNNTSTNGYFVSYGNGLFVAGSRQIMTSPDGINWTARTTENNYWRDVTYGNGMWVLVAYFTYLGTNKMMTSPDGITWTATSYNPEKMYAVAYGQGKFVIVGATNGDKAAVSPAFSYSYDYTVNQANGSTYVDGSATVSLSTTTDLLGNTPSTVTNSLFTIDTTSPAVALSYSRNPAGLGINTISTTYNEPIIGTPTISINQPGSTDITNASMVSPATNWTARTASEANAWMSVAYGNNTFVAVTGSGTNRVMTSGDGITWTARSASEASAWRAVTYGNGLFVAVATAGTNRVMTSPDGITWTSRSASEANAWNSVIYGNGLFVAVSSSGTNRVMTSPDGITWTPRSASEASSWYSVTYGNGLFVAVAPYKTMTSYDGITWTARSNPNGWWNSVAYGNGVYVAVSSSGTFASSSADGITWTDRSSVVALWMSVTYGNGLFVATSQGSNKIMTSINGTTWTQRTPPEANNWNSIIYGNNIFVAVSENGTNRVMTSPNSYLYDYTVNQANGSTYIDGTATVSLSSLTDVVGNTVNAPTNNTFEIDTTGPTVALSYSKNLAGVGTNTITATYSKSIVGTPNISINQPGSTDISNVAMSGSGATWTYSYTVNQATGSTYIDGTATVSLSSVLDVAGNTSSAPTNTTFTIDTVAPTAGITYSPNRPVKSGDSLVITATFSEAMADAPLPKIALSGVATLSATDMTKVDTTHYSYTYTVGAGNGTATVALSTGTDIGGNIIASTPTSGATFVVDNIAPTGIVTAICSTAGNECTTVGQNATPQESYIVSSIAGTAEDEVSGSGLSTINISIKDTTTNLWYNGTSFADSSENYLTATGTTTWSYNTSSAPLVIDHIYDVNIKVNDASLNNLIIPLSFKFTNSPPVVSNVAITDNTNGQITLTYDVTDIESTQTTNYLFYGVGATLNGDINSAVTSLTVSSDTYLPASGSIIIDDEIITYTSKASNVLSGLTRGALSTTAIAHTTGANIFVKANTVSGSGVGASDKGTDKTIIWNAKTDADGYQSTSAVIRVVANDGSTGSMIGSLSSSTFTLDVKSPTEIISFDAGIAGQAGSATITIPMPSDISPVYYKISDDADSQTDPTTSDWVLMSTSTTIPWSFDSGIEVKTLKYQWKDNQGNTSSEQTVSTHMPVSSGSFMVQDTSNVSATPPYYDLYIGWQATEATGFASYKLEYSTATDNSNYGSYTSIVSSSFSDVNTNYYVYRNLDSSLYYRFRLSVVDTNGNISVRSNSFTTAKPDGVQNYGEGGGGSVLTASKVENVVVAQNEDKTVSVTYKLTDGSIGKKVNPTYEARIFYNIGIILPSNALVGSTLTISDASKLKSSGYIQINNEVLRYTGKTGNTLSGIVRGTWPTDVSSGRATRSNPAFLAGTPVWIMANGTTPVSITNTTITTGQSGSITWNTYDESALAGYAYPNTDIRVIVHDNQDALSGPLSSQNDYSENGSLSNLDLTAPGISFSASSGSGNESITPVTLTLNLTRAYPLAVSVPYTLTGTATSADYTLTNGVATISAGLTSTTINIPIINDEFKEIDNTIIVTLGTPTNAILGTNSVYTYTIINDDETVDVASLPTIGFSALTSESDEDVNTVNIPVTISAPYEADVTVNYSVTGGTAEGSSVDYLLNNGTLTILAGQTTTNINLIIFEDEIAESAETITITLANPVNATLGANTIHSHSILDNEIAVTEVSSNIKATSARIFWTTADFTDSFVEYGTIAPGTEGAYSLSKTQLDKVLEHSVYLGNLIPSTTYYYRATSTNLNGESTVSESQFTTTAGPVITNVTVSDITDTTAKITWITDLPSTSYVSFSVNGDLTSPTRSGAVDLVNEHSVTLINLSGETLYYFSVDGADGSSNVSESTNNNNYYTFTTGEDGTAPIISDIAVPIITSNQAAIVWKTNELSDGIVKYSTTQGDYSNESELISVPTVNHLIALSGLTNSTKYYYIIESTDANDNTTTTEEKTFTTIAADQLIVSGGGGTVGVAQELYNIILAENQAYKNKIGAINGESPVISNIEIYDITAFGATVSFDTSEETIAFIEYGKTDNYGSTTADNNWAGNHTIKLNGLSLGTKYYFVIKAMDKTNDIGTSEEEEFTTKFLTENLAELRNIDNIEQFQAEIEATIESILPSLVPPFIDKPTISDITENSAVVTFRTNIKAYPVVSYTADETYDVTKKDTYDGQISDTSTKNISHTLSLIGLKSNTKYHVKVKAFSLPQVVGESEDFTFITKASKIHGSIIDVKKDSFNVVWTTDEPTTSIVEYKNIKTGRISRIVDGTLNSSHSVPIENLSPDTIYEVNISGVNAKGNAIEGGTPLNVKTSMDNIPPTITNLKVDSSLIVGQNDKAQTIVSWQTDEPSTSTVYYEEGVGSSTKSLANKQEDLEFTKNHVVILTGLRAGTIYRFTVNSTDDANNITKSPVRTIITPKKTESIVDIIFKNFDDTFNFINNVK